MEPTREELLKQVEWLTGLDTNTVTDVVTSAVSDIQAEAASEGSGADWNDFEEWELLDFLAREIPRIVRSKRLHEIYEGLAKKDRLVILEGRIDRQTLKDLCSAYYELEQGPSGGYHTSGYNSFLKARNDYAGTIYDLHDNPYVFD